jgi:hypothetical protein
VLDNSTGNEFATVCSGPIPFRQGGGFRNGPGETIGSELCPHRHVQSKRGGPCPSLVPVPWWPPLGRPTTWHLRPTLPMPGYPDLRPIGRMRSRVGAMKSCFANRRSTWVPSCDNYGMPMGTAPCWRGSTELPIQKQQVFDWNSRRYSFNDYSNGHRALHGSILCSRAFAVFC